MNVALFILFCVYFFIAIMVAALTADGLKDDCPEQIVWKDYATLVRRSPWAVMALSILYCAVSGALWPFGVLADFYRYEDTATGGSTLEPLGVKIDTEHHIVVLEYG